MILWSIIPYAIWQLSYHFLITVGQREKIAAGRPTSFTWLRRSYSKAWIGQFVTSFPEYLHEPAFMLIQFMYALLTMMPCPIWLWYRHASSAFLMAVFCWSIYNGATYYIDVFGKRFQNELEAMKREAAKWQNSPDMMTSPLMTPRTDDGATDLPPSTPTTHGSGLQETNASPQKGPNGTLTWLLNHRDAVAADVSGHKIYNTAKTASMFILASRKDMNGPALYSCCDLNCTALLPMPDLLSHYEVHHKHYRRLDDPLRLVCRMCEAFYTCASDECLECYVPSGGLTEALYGEFLPDMPESYLLGQSVIFKDQHEAGDEVVVHWATIDGKEPHRDPLPASLVGGVKRVESNLTGASSGLPRREERAVLGSAGERKTILGATDDGCYSTENDGKQGNLGAKLAKVYPEQVMEELDTSSHLTAEKKGSQDAPFRAIHPLSKARNNQESALLGIWKPELVISAGRDLTADSGALVASLIATGTNNSINEHSTAEPLLPRPEDTSFPSGYEHPRYAIEDNMRDEDTLCTQSDGSMDASDDVSGSASEESVVNGDRFLVPFLDTARRAVVDKLMQEVWVIFDQTWTANYTTFAGSAPPSSSSSRGEASTFDGKSIHKRQRQENDDVDSSTEHNSRAPKRLPPNHIPTGGDEERLELSCPFRKHDPRKYRCPTYRTCARNSWDSIGRVK
jgi:hypothetical protein